MNDLLEDWLFFGIFLAVLVGVCLAPRVLFELFTRIWKGDDE